MGEKKSSTILLTVIGIATLLVTLVGATFAYFTAGFDEQYQNGDNDGKDVIVTAANLGEITFAHGDTVTLNNVLPGDSDTKTFTISAAQATVPIDYVIYLDTTVNSVATGKTETPNLVAKLTSSNATATSLLDGTTGKSILSTTNYAPDNSEETKVEIGRGKLAVGVSDTWTLTVTLNETEGPQNDDQGRAYTGTIVVEAATQYTQQNVYTTTQP